LLEKGRERGQNRWAESFTLKKVSFRPALFLTIVMSSCVIWVCA